ncbi:hypothetical protein GQ457_08G019120 [Hibiscus cannabinus]
MDKDRKGGMDMIVMLHRQPKLVDKRGREMMVLLHLNMLCGALNLISFVLYMLVANGHRSTGGLCFQVLSFSSSFPLRKCKYDTLQTKLLLPLSALEMVMTKNKTRVVEISKLLLVKRMIGKKHIFFC